MKVVYYINYLVSYHKNLYIKQLKYKKLVVENVLYNILMYTFNIHLTMMYS